MFFRILLVSALVACCVLLVSCGGGDRLLVFAASSLTDSMQQLAEVYEERTGMRVDLSFGASNRLAQQILRGAPADVLVTAGVQPVERLEDEMLTLEGSRRPLLTNRLVVVVRADGQDRVSSLQELADAGGGLAIADPDLAPAGRYAREALVHLGLWAGLQSRLVFGANVRATLGYVEAGNVEAALVYRTDAGVSEGVRVVETVAEGAHAPIVYPAVVLAASDKEEQAAAFIEFLGSEDASQVFRGAGFEMVAGR